MNSLDAKLVAQASAGLDVVQGSLLFRKRSINANPGLRSAGLQTPLSVHLHLPTKTSQQIKTYSGCRD